MENTLVAPNFREAYLSVVSDVLNYGRVAYVQGGAKTRELLGYKLVLHDPTRSLLTDMNRGLNLGIAAAEAAQLIGGVSDPALMVRISKNFARFLDAGAFHGAYGPRLKTQLPALLDRLTKDSTSRQALLNIWRPQDDLFDGARDLPCTLTLQFLVREDKLHAIVNMRSNDVYWGLSYDAFQFTQLQITLANILGVGVGTYTHLAGSMHIYERDIVALEKMHHPTQEQEDRVFGFNSLERARRVIEWVGDHNQQLHPDTESEYWYINALAKYRP